MTTLSTGTVPTMSRSSNTASTTRNRESRKRHNDDDLIVRIAHEMPLFKFVPVAWLSERWDDDVGEWLRTMPEEQRRAFGYDYKVLEDAELGPGKHMCMVVVGPGAHKSWNQVRHEMIVSDRDEFEQLLAPTAAKARRARRWLVHDSEDADENTADAESRAGRPLPLVAKRLVFDLDSEDVLIDENPADAESRAGRPPALVAKRLVFDLDEVDDDDDKAEECGARACGGKSGKAQDPRLWCDFLMCTDAPSASIPAKQSRRLQHGNEFYDELYPLSKLVGCVEPVYIEEAWEDHQAFATSFAQ